VVDDGDGPETDKVVSVVDDVDTGADDVDTGAAVVAAVGAKVVGGVVVDVVGDVVVVVVIVVVVVVVVDVNVVEVAIVEVGHTAVVEVTHKQLAGFTEQSCDAVSAAFGKRFAGTYKAVKVEIAVRERVGERRNRAVKSIVVQGAADSGETIDEGQARSLTELEDATAAPTQSGSCLAACCCACREQSAQSTKPVQSAQCRQGD
jgi:hypothetical protein